MRDWSVFLSQARELVAGDGGRENWDAAAHLLLDKDELDRVLWAKRSYLHPGWDLVDYALSYLGDEIPF